MSLDRPKAPEIEDLGRMPFDPVHAQMLEICESIRLGYSDGKILLVEHEPVFTAGRATPQAELSEKILPIERGGQITYHGPGQLVVYPILRLPIRDVRAWLRRLESFGVAICANFGLTALPSQDGTGVFVANKKVASIGVAIRHWINIHGIAINIDMDLTPFQEIRPCGLAPDIMSNLSSQAGRSISMAAAKAAVPEALTSLLA